MKRLPLYIAFCATILAAVGPGRLESTPGEVDRSQLKRNWMTYVPGQVLVQYRPSVSEGYAAMNVNGKRHAFLKALPRLDKRKGPMAVVQLKERTTVEEAVRQFENDPDVEYAQPNYIYRVKAAPNDYLYEQLWGLKNTNQTVTGGTYTNNPPGASYVDNDIDAEAAWDVITDCSSVTVAVIDSGVNYNHVDLTANMANGSYTCPVGTGTRGCDFVGAGDNDPMDYNGHGTHVAGTIGAQGNNSEGVAGICWSAKILAVRVLDATGSGSTSDIVEGLAFAVGTGAGQGNAKVVNMSLGGGSSDTAFSNAITTARTNGVVVVVAAGNEGNNTNSVPSYPCNYTQDNILCVAAADQRYTRASFSNYSSTHVDIAAPGTNILSTYAGETTSTTYDMMTGWTTATTSGTSWGMSDCTSVALGGTYPMLLLPNACSTVLAGTSTTGYLSNTDATIYKNLSVPTGSDGLSISLYITMDLEQGYDWLDGFHNNVAGNPVTSGSTFLVGSGEFNGGWAYYETELQKCAGATTCSVGFRVDADSSDNRAGVGITALGLTGFDVDVIDSFVPENGTSMAAPHVAGVATMVRARNPNFTYTDTINAILNGGDTAIHTTLSTSITKSGKTLNAFGALKYIPQTEGVTVNTP